ncbi:hypothetical protein X801_05119, partial [Opisthorchis viverrini]
MHTRSHGKTEEEPVASGGSFWSLCYRIAGFIHTRSPPNIPPPDKFCLGDNFRRWAADTSEYIKLFPASERKRVLLSLLDGEARDIVRDEHILKDGVTEDVFERLRACLTERIHPVEHQYRFQSRIQLSGERLSIIVRELRRISEDAFPDLHKGQREENALEQIIVGTPAPKLRERFLGDPPHSVVAALQVANQVEDIRQQQQSRHWTPARGRPYHPMPLRPNRPYFHSTFQRPAPTNLPGWPTPSRDCPYCQRFEARTRTCGHNRPREFTHFRCVPICTFDFLSTHRTPR